jgi:TRAP-type C4-dicarboxylate transport system permease small subunit
VHDAIVQGLVMLFAVVLLVVGGGRLVGLTIDLKQVSASLRIPMGAIYTALPIGGVIMAVYALLNIIEGPPPEAEGGIKTEAEAHAAEGA